MLSMFVVDGTITIVSMMSTLLVERTILSMMSMLSMEFPVVSMVHGVDGTDKNHGGVHIIDILTNISATNSSWNHCIERPCFALGAPTRNTPALTLLSENVPGGFLCFPCFLRLLRVLRDRPNANFKTKIPALLQDKNTHTKFKFYSTIKSFFFPQAKKK